MSNDDPYDAEAEDDEVEPDADGTPPAEGGRRPRMRRSQQADTSDLLNRVVELVHAARPMPLSASAMINKEEVLDLLEEAADRFPTELREARWLLKEREEYLAKMRADGDEIVDAARARAEHMVQRAEVVKAAEQRARRVVDAAEAEARRLRLECEDFCDQRLASFEVVLERTLKTVAGGREKLQSQGSRPEQSPAPADDGSLFPPLPPS